MKTESYKILEQRRVTLQQMVDSNIGETFEGVELFRAELKERLSNIEAALNFISTNPLVGGSVCCHATIIKFKTYGYDECSECGKIYKSDITSVCLCDEPDIAIDSNDIEKFCTKCGQAVRKKNN